MSGILLRTVYVVLGQLGWWGLVGYVHEPEAQWAVSVGIVLGAAVHVCMHPTWLLELVRITSLALCGWMFESVWVRLGLVLYPQNPGVVAPAWMAVLWLLFALQTQVLMKALNAHLIILVVLGVIGGPLAYRAGEALGAIRVVHNMDWLVLALAWAIAVPTILRYSSLFDKELS